MNTKRAVCVLVTISALLLGWNRGYPALAHVLFERGNEPRPALPGLGDAVTEELDQTLAAQLLTENTHPADLLTEGARARSFGGPVETVRLMMKIITVTTTTTAGVRIVPLTPVGPAETATPRAGAASLLPPPGAPATPTRGPAGDSHSPPPASTVSNR
jgi:hypothetical protein